MTAGTPNTIISLQYVDCASCFTDIRQFFHFLIQFIFIECFYGDDIICGTFVDSRQRTLTEFTAHHERLIIHEFDTGRFDTGLQILFGKLKLWHLP
jgi:hypothetical protein